MDSGHEIENYEDAVEASPGDVSGAHDSGLLYMLVLHGVSDLLTSPTERRRERESVLCSP